MKIVGLDLSLTSTGVAVIDGAGYTTLTLKTKTTGHERLRWLVQQVGERTLTAGLVVVEGPAYNARASQQGHHERAGLWWMVTHELWTWGIPTAVASPAAVKKYATGNGSASKDAVLSAVIRRFAGYDGSSNDEADALTLAALGAQWSGQPIVTMPQLHREALGKVAWPEVKP